MTPIYFPFTFVSSASCFNLFSCFSRIAVYQAIEGILPEDMKSLAEKDFIEIRIPVRGNKGKLQALLKEYKSWADIHQGGNMAFFKSQAKSIPFFDDASISKITDDIKKTIKNSKALHNKGNELYDQMLAARLFLSIAQEYDVFEAEIIRQMNIIKLKEKDVFCGLKGESEDFDDLIFQQQQKQNISEDVGDYLTSERINAWAKLLFEDKIGSGVFVTSSRAVFENLLESSADAGNLISFSPVPVSKDGSGENEKFKKQLIKFFNHLAEEEIKQSELDLPDMHVEVHNEKKVSLSAYFVPGVNPMKYFSRFVRDTEPPFKEISSSPYKNTVICLVE